MSLYPFKTINSLINEIKNNPALHSDMAHINNVKLLHHFKNNKSKSYNSGAFDEVDKYHHEFYSINRHMYQDIFQINTPLLGWVIKFDGTHFYLCDTILICLSINKLNFNMFYDGHIKIGENALIQLITKQLVNVF
jgi:hypothetical protein